MTSETPHTAYAYSHTVAPLTLPVIRHVAFESTTCPSWLTLTVTSVRCSATIMMMAIAIPTCGKRSGAGDRA